MIKPRLLQDLQFGVFEDDGHGPMWKASYGYIQEAIRLAQMLADNDGHEFFVFSFQTHSEIARSYPTRNGAPA